MTYRREEPQTREYVVIGPRVVGGAKKGERVTLSLFAAQERALIESGHVRRVERKVVTERGASDGKTRSQGLRGHD